MTKPTFSIIKVRLESPMDTPQRTPEGQLSTASVLVVRMEDRYVIFVEDHGHGCSVTNGAVQICRFVHDQLLADVPYSSIRWVYRDTSNEVDEIVTNGASASFRHLIDDDEQLLRAVKVVRTANFRLRIT